MQVSLLHFRAYQQFSRFSYTFRDFTNKYKNTYLILCEETETNKNCTKSFIYRFVEHSIRVVHLIQILESCFIQWTFMNFEPQVFRTYFALHFPGQPFRWNIMTSVACRKTKSLLFLITANLKRKPLHLPFLIRPILLLNNGPRRKKLVLYEWVQMNHNVNCPRIKNFRNRHNRLRKQRDKWDNYFPDKN